jgi:arsenate reductase
MALVRILYVCTGNSCRSQMAEAWTRRLKADAIEAHSAGIEAHGLNRVAVRVMEETGIDISHYRSKKLDVLRNVRFDYVITLCGDADDKCPVFPPDVRVVHQPFDDPPALARTAPTEEAGIDHYRRVRDEIRRFVESLPESLPGINGEGGADESPRTEP